MIIKRILGAAFACAALLTTSLSAQEGTWQSLFDGKSLTGWQANESPGTWVIEDGAIVTKGPRSHLFYNGHVGAHDFKNFEFSAEVMTTPGSNSGIYIHTKLAPDPWPTKGYECQIFNSGKAEPGKYLERKMTGSIYAVRNTWKAPVADNQWFEYRIKVTGRSIQTFINNELICQYTESSKHWRADDKQGRRLSSGTIALQGHDPHSTVKFRNLRIRILPIDSKSVAHAMDDLELDELIGRMSDQNFALIDAGIVGHKPAQVLAQEARARRLGVTLGQSIAPGGIDLTRLGAAGPVLVVNDRYAPPSVTALKAAKAQGTRILFSSGGLPVLSPDRLKARIKAIQAAGLSWSDLWAP